MSGDLIRRFEAVKNNCVLADQKLSELTGRMTAEEEAKKKIVDRLSKDYQIKTVTTLRKKVEELRATLENRVGDLEKVFES